MADTFVSPWRNALKSISQALLNEEKDGSKETLSQTSKKNVVDTENSGKGPATLSTAIKETTKLVNGDVSYLGKDESGKHRFGATNPKGDYRIFRHPSKTISQIRATKHSTSLSEASEGGENGDQSVRAKVVSDEIKDGLTPPPSSQTSKSEPFGQGKELRNKSEISEDHESSEKLKNLKAQAALNAQGDPLKEAKRVPFSSLATADQTSEYKQGFEVGKTGKPYNQNKYAQGTYAHHNHKQGWLEGKKSSDIGVVGETAIPEVDKHGTDANPPETQGHHMSESKVVAYFHNNHRQTLGKDAASHNFTVSDVGHPDHYEIHHWTAQGVSDTHPDFRDPARGSRSSSTTTKLPKSELKAWVKKMKADKYTGGLEEDNTNLPSMTNESTAIRLQLGEASFAGNYGGHHFYISRNKLGGIHLHEGNEGISVALSAIAEANNDKPEAGGVDVKAGEYKYLGKHGEAHWYITKDPNGTLAYTRNRDQKRADRDASVHANPTSLKEDELNELSNKTLGSYVKKATGQVQRHSHTLGYVVGVNGNPVDYRHPHYDFRKGIIRTVKNRRKGIEQAVDKLQETLPPNASAGTYIDDFVHSKNSKFEGKSKKERIRMALGAYYGHHKEDITDKESSNEKGQYKVPERAAGHLPPKDMGSKDHELDEASKKKDFPSKNMVTAWEASVKLKQHQFKPMKVKPIKEDIKVGDHVHMGLGTKGGAGYTGKVTKIEGDKVHIQSHTSDKYGPKTFSGHISNVIKEVVGDKAEADPAGTDVTSTGSGQGIGETVNKTTDEFMKTAKKASIVREARGASLVLTQESYEKKKLTERLSWKGTSSHDADVMKGKDNDNQEPKDEPQDQDDNTVTEEISPKEQALRKIFKHIQRKFPKKNAPNTSGYYKKPEAKFVNEGLTGPSRITLQKTYDNMKWASTEHARIKHVEKAHSVKNVKVNSQGDIIHFELNEEREYSVKDKEYADRVIKTRGAKGLDPFTPPEHHMEYVKKHGFSHDAEYQDLTHAKKTAFKTYDPKKEHFNNLLRSMGSDHTREQKPYRHPDGSYHYNFDHHSGKSWAQLEHSPRKGITSVSFHPSVSLKEAKEEPKEKPDPVRRKPFGEFKKGLKEPKPEEKTKGQQFELDDADTTPEKDRPMNDDEAEKKAKPPFGKDDEQQPGDKGSENNIKQDGDEKPKKGVGTDENPPVKLTGAKDKIIMNPVMVVRDLSHTSVTPPQNSSGG